MGTSQGMRLRRHPGYTFGSVIHAACSSGMAVAKGRRHTLNEDTCPERVRAALHPFARQGFNLPRVSSPARIGSNVFASRSPASPRKRSATAVAGGIGCDGGESRCVRVPKPRRCRRQIVFHVSGSRTPVGSASFDALQMRALRASSSMNPLGHGRALCPRASASVRRVDPTARSKRSSYRPPR
jgi:hypothetical protein